MFAGTSAEHQYPGNGKRDVNLEKRSSTSHPSNCPTQLKDGNVWYACHLNKFADM